MTRSRWALFSCLIAGIIMLLPEDTGAHVITNYNCRINALEKSREVAPATRAEFNARYNACIRRGKAHNATHRAKCEFMHVELTIRCVWGYGNRGRQAVTVAYCESNNGRGWAAALRALGPRDEYGNRRVGLFQLGTYERKRSGQYTTRSTAVVQAKSAHKWYELTGNDWGAWECKP